MPWAVSCYEQLLATATKLKGQQSSCMSCNMPGPLGPHAGVPEGQDMTAPTTTEHQQQQVHRYRAMHYQEGQQGTSSSSRHRVVQCL